ncbi:MAG: ABC transporter ATP-binding protein [Micrococcales bacterium]|nr:MAG: ABC transporter ATP-binding protein [Micrococcales bacterium]
MGGQAGSGVPDVIQVRDVSKRFVLRKDKSLKDRVTNFAASQRHKDSFWALRHVSLDVPAGSTIGLVGPNGSGKSTLLKTIGGIIQPTSGTVHRRGRLAALLELGAGFHPDLTGRENVYLNASILGLTQAQTDEYFDDIVAFSGIEKFIDTQVKFYSSGMYVRLAFAVAVHVDPDVLLVDEVLAVGDEPFQRKCMDRIRTFQREGRTIVLVSHALGQVAELCDRAVVLEAGHVVEDGPPRDALRRLRDDYETARRAEEQARGVAGTRAEVVSVRAADTVEGRCRLRPGDSLALTVRVAAHDDLANWVLGIGIDTPLGHNVFGTHTGLLGADVPDVPAGQQREITFQLPDLPLGEGEYFVHGAVAEAGGGEIHRLPQGLMLQVTSRGDSVGYLDVPVTVGH